MPATSGFVNREDMFFVSHFWRSSHHPDPDGQYLRLNQEGLRVQRWSYIWVDWTCMPQSPRKPEEDAYFVRALETMSALIRNCGFMWFYPPFEPRLWILYEVTEYYLTCDQDLVSTDDNEQYVTHNREMLQLGVRPVLWKHHYRCTNHLDQAFLTSWLEVLILLTKLGLHIVDVRHMLDNLSWLARGEVYIHLTYRGGTLSIDKFKGTLSLEEKDFTFTPFPKWGTSALALD